MTKGTRLVATIRHPMSQLISAFHHYGLDQLLNLSMYEDPIAEFLTDPAKLDKLLPGSLYNPIARTANKLSFTKNRMAFEFGFDLNRTSTQSYINEHMMELDKAFDIVLINEKYDESLLLLRKLFCWEYTDILYMKHREQNYKQGNYKQFLERHRNWTNLDYMLYDHFLAKHNHIVNQLGEGFQQEVAYFQNLLRNVTKFCLPNMKNSLLNKTIDSSIEITIHKSMYHPEFRVNLRHCLAMGLSEGSLRKLAFSHQYKRDCWLNKDKLKSRCMNFTIQTNDPLFGYKEIVQKDFSIRG
jgi:galactosylceramide sulfotransferase/galactose-3-O-sulfotransferase 3